MFVVICQNKDVCQDEAGNTIFTHEQAVELVKWLTDVLGYDPKDYKIAKLSFLD